MMPNFKVVQQKLCARFGAEFYGIDLNQKVGISKNVRDGLVPLNGVRHPPTSDTSGWYIWSGIEQSKDPDFFVPLHGFHLPQWIPIALPYLGLPPGWGFVVAPNYEDVWFDPGLLVTEIK
jgi:hypothetical protein